jgi:predicted transcriptional regulator
VSIIRTKDLPVFDPRQKPTVPPDAEKQFLRAVGERIREHRQRLGLSVIDLSRVSGVGYDTIYCVERGDYSTQILTYWRLAQGLRVTVESLMRGIK